MKLLYLPQLSMRSYATGEWLVDSDSQVVKMKAWMKHLPDDWQWTWLVPNHGVSVDVEQIALSWAPNVQTDRYNFPMYEMIKILADDDYDIVICEAIEKVFPIKTALEFLGKDVPVVGMIGLFDDRQAAFYIRQLEGFFASDLVVFPLDAIRTMWFDRVNALFSFTLDTALTRVWPALYDPEEVLSYRPETRLTNERPVVHFISRLSNPMYKSEEFFEAVRLLEQKYEFDVWVANPNDAMDRSSIHKLAESVVKVGPWTRQTYMQKLWQSDIVPILYPQDRVYSTGFCEAIIANNLVIEAGRSGIAGVQVPATVAGIGQGIETALQLVGKDTQLLMTQHKQLYEMRSVKKHASEIRSGLELLTKGSE